MLRRLFLVCAVLILTLGRPAAAVTASASSAEKDSVAARLAVDGDFNTRWSSSFSDPQWLEVDLGAAQDVVGVSIYWESAHAKRYRVLTSSDRQKWDAAYSIANGVGGLDDIHFARRRCRYLKLELLERGSEWGYSIWELTPKGTNEELTVAASSAAPGRGPENLLDGNPETGWQPSGSETGAWLQLRSAAGFVLAGIELDWHGARPASVAVQTSDDGQTWDACCTGLDIDRPPVTIAGPHFIRLVFPGTLPADAGLADVRLTSWRTVERARDMGVYRCIVGDEAYEWVTFVGRDGSFVPEPQPARISFLLSDGHGLHSPTVSDTDWAIEDGRYPMSRNSWKAGDASVTTRTFARRIPSLGRLITLSRTTVKNTSAMPKTVQLHVVVGPNVLSGKWNVRFERVQFDGLRTVNVNGKPVLFLGRAPAATTETALLRRAARAAPLETGAEVVPDAVVEGGVLSFDLALGPGAEENVDLYAVGGEQGEVTAAAVTPLAFEKEWAAAREFWSGRVPTRIELPDRRYTDAFYASINYLLVMMKGNALFPGPYNYKGFFLHDLVEMNMALDSAGLHDVAARVTDGFDWKEWGGYVDEMGGSLYGMYSHYELTQDRAYLERVFPRMVSTCRLAQKIREPQLAEEMRGKDWYGLVRQSVSQDNFSIPAYLYVDNWWAIVGLKSAAEAARILGRAEDEAWITAEYKNLLECTLASIRAVMEREGVEYMPGFADNWPASERKKDAEHRILGDTQMAWAHRPALYPGESLGIPLPRDLFRRSYERYWKQSGRFSAYDGGWFVEYENLFWGYNVQLAIPMMYLGMEDVTLSNIEWSLRRPSCPGGWAEGMLTRVNKKALREIAEGPIVGDVPHGWTAGYYVLLFRNMLLREQGDRLLLLPCIRTTWLSGDGISVQKAPTRFGEISFTARAEGESDLRLTVSAEKPPPGGYELRIPADWKATGLSVDGKPAEAKPGEWLVLPAEARDVLVSCEPR